MNQCLQVEGLGKEVGEGDGLDGVSRGDKHAQIAGEGCRVAGDVDHGGGSDPCKQSGNVRAKAGAGRIYNHQVGVM